MSLKISSKIIKPKVNSENFYDEKIAFSSFMHIRIFNKNPERERLSKQNQKYLTLISTLFLLTSFKICILIESD